MGWQHKGKKFQIPFSHLGSFRRWARLVRVSFSRRSVGWAVEFSPLATQCRVAAGVVVVPLGIEPRSLVPETRALSIRRRNRVVRFGNLSLHGAFGNPFSNFL